MLATKVNTKFFPPVKSAGDVGDTRTAQFYFEHEGKLKMCEISILVAAVLGQTEDELQEALVQEINDRLCKEFPYEQLIELKALAPRVSAEDALAGTVASAANNLVVQGAVPDTWPLVCDEFVKIFSPAVSTTVMQEVVRFFQPVVNKFTKRAYDTGWGEGRKTGITHAQSAMIKSLCEMRDQESRNDGERVFFQELIAGMEKMHL